MTATSAVPSWTAERFVDGSLGQRQRTPLVTRPSLDERPAGIDESQ
jgi:hypothetical protein